MEAFESEAIADAEDDLPPRRVEGWMKVFDVGPSSDPSLYILLTTRWLHRFCVLHTTVMGQHLSQFTSEKESEVVVGDGEVEKTLRIGAESDDTSSYESAREEVPCEEKKKAARSSSRRREKKLKTQSHIQHHNDSGYEKPLLKEQRRGSVPSVVPTSAPEDPSDALSPPNRLMSFISRKSSQLKSNLKRAKSATKLEPKKSEGGVVVNGDTIASSPLSSLKRTMSLSRLSRRWQGRPRPGQERSDSAGEGDRSTGEKMRTSQSHESLLTNPSTVTSLDLNLPYIQIKPLSTRVFGQEHCFQVSTTNSTKFFACRSDQERQKWIQHLQRTVQPFQDQTRRTDRSLELWILEATNLPAKQRYFCEIYLDSTLYGRTSSKVNGALLFWAEQFDMTNLPAFNKLIVKLFREGNRSKRKEVNIFIGQVEVAADKISDRQMTESKFPVTSSVVGRIGKDASLRMKSRYQRIDILPITCYQPFLEYLMTEYRPLVMLLESTLLHVREKEELARALVYIMQKSGCAKEFLVNILVDEINKQENQKILLRSNSIASKAIDVYMKLVGEKYLRDTLSDFVNLVLNSQLSLEVDSKVVPNSVDLSSQKKHLLDFCQTVWFKIFNSHSSMPMELKLVFHELRRHVLFKTTGDDEVARQLISSCLFLRFLCPAILSPSLFGLTQVFPQDKDARNLTLIAKAIQGLANFAKFGGGKEDFMIFLNQFVEREASNLKLFLDQISTVDTSRVYPAEDCCVVDLGRELSVLHSLLLESSNILMEKATEESREKVAILIRILSDITEAKKSQSGASHQPKTPRASSDVYQNGYSRASSSAAGAPLVLEMRTPVDDSIDGSNPGSQASTPRFVSNTSFMLTGGSTTPSLSSDAGGSFCDIPRTRNTMREMQDSDLYISMTSEKSLPVLPPVTSASVLFGSRLTDRPPHASSPTTSSAGRLMFAAETNSNDFSTDVMSMIDNVLTNMVNPKEIARGANHPLPGQKGSSTSLCQPPPGNASTGTLGRQQPLAFSNPLYSCPPGPRLSQTPPIFPGMGTLPGESDRKHCPTGSVNGSTIDSIQQSLAPLALPRNTSPSPSLGEGQSLQRTGFLYGCHSHENLPYHHQRVASTSNSVHPPNRNSAVLAVSDVDLYFAASSGGVMSRSMEFPLPPVQPPIGPDSILKRNNTDSLIILPRSAPGLSGLDTPPESPTFCSVGYPVGRRNGQSQGTVRMGVRSMQRKLQESEKGKLEYELELRHLHQQLAEMRRMQEKEKAAAVAAADAEWHQKLRQLENEHHEKMAEKDQEMSLLKRRLLSSEQQNQRNEATIRDLQHQLKDLLLQKPRSLATTHNATLDGRQCSTH